VHQLCANFHKRLLENILTGKFSPKEGILNLNNRDINGCSVACFLTMNMELIKADEDGKPEIDQ